MMSIFANTFDWPSLIGVIAPFIGSGFSFFLSGWGKWILIITAVAGTAIAFLWVDIDRANLRTAAIEATARQMAAEEARDRAKILADENAMANRDLVAVYAQETKRLGDQLKKERTRQIETDSLIYEVFRNATPVPANCPAVSDAISRALDGVRELRAASRPDQK